MVVSEEEVVDLGREQSGLHQLCAWWLARSQTSGAGRRVLARGSFRSGWAWAWESRLPGCKSPPFSSSLVCRLQEWRQHTTNVLLPRLHRHLPHKAAMGSRYRVEDIAGKGTVTVVAVSFPPGKKICSFWQLCMQAMIFKFCQG
jgi:hypothetical protein